jgi:hypothetical protein
VAWCQDRANEAKSNHISIHVIGVGADIDGSLCEEIASKPEFFYYADSGPDPSNNNQPYYISQISEIFEQIADERPSRLIQYTRKVRNNRPLFLRARRTMWRAFFLIGQA